MKYYVKINLKIIKMKNNYQLNKYLKIIGVALIAVVLITSCAKSIDLTACVGEKTYGFWNGLWHGLISPVTFIVSLFKERVAVYGVNNNGGWYDFGFLLGVAITFGGSSKASCHSKKSCC